ncbi:MAG: hypothetical protein WCX48_08445 [Bacteroidales bacterium]
MAAHKKYQGIDYDKLFDDIMNDIVEQNMSASKAMIGKMSYTKFWDMLNEDKTRADKYARACILRAERVNDEILDIADDKSNDTLEIDLGDGVLIEKENKEFIQRSRVRIDARKWWLSKTNPKKYGEKLDITSDNKQLVTPQIIVKTESEKEIMQGLLDKE